MEPTNADSGQPSLMNASQPYQYTPTRYDEIRLVHLLPANDPTEPLRCRLETLKLSINEGLNYETLSYTWGSEAASEMLIVHDSTYVEITPNLASFLRHRRETDKEVVLWVDAVCINQQDIAERNRQVPIMNLIYYECNAINIWLGEESDDSDFALDLLR